MLTLHSLVLSNIILTDPELRLEKYFKHPVTSDESLCDNLLNESTVKTEKGKDII